MTLRDLMQLGNSPEIEIWILDPDEQKVVPAKCYESFRKGEPIIVIEKLSWVERGGDI